MSEPLVSVRMITYNHKPYIAKAIECVLQQKTDFPFELVIGEDCSTDGTCEIVLEYQKNFPQIIRVITSEKNVGARKNGYRADRACNGKYIAYCEGDDYWHHPDKLQIQVDYMESHPECGLTHSDYDRFLAKSGTLIKKFNKKMNLEISDDLDVLSILRGGKYLFILTCTVMVRKKILHDMITQDELLYQSNRFLLGDTSRWAEIAHRSKTHYFDKSLSTYNVLQESASKTSESFKQLKFGKSVSDLKLYLVDKYNLPKSEKDYHTRLWCQSALPLAFYQKDRSSLNDLKKKKEYFTLKGRVFFYGLSNDFFYKTIFFLIKIKVIIFKGYYRLKNIKPGFSA